MEIVGSWSDITARKDAESTREFSRARLSVLLGAAPAVVYSFAASGDFAPTFVSENIERMLGYLPEEYLEHADFWRSCVHPEDIAESNRSRSTFLPTASISPSIDFRKKNGSYCWVSDAQHLIQDRHGNRSEVVGSWSDIDARKEAELALQRHQVKLERGEPNCLTKPAQGLRVYFCANIEQTIRTPMSAIIGLSHLALKTDLTTRQHDYVVKIRSSDNTLLGIINDILDFSKVGRASWRLRTSTSISIRFSATSGT